MAAEEEDKTNVVVVGLGPVGQRIARRLLARADLRVVGAADLDPAHVGRDVGDVVGADRPAGVEVAPGIPALDADPGPAGVAVLATTSRLSTAVEPVAALVRGGWNVLSTCEELSFPWVIDEGAAKELDSLARVHRVSVLGAGINPGFLLDALVLALRYSCATVDAVRVERRVDTNRRRVPLQQKVGVGLTKAEFEEGSCSGRIGHVGLVQSAHLLAAGLGWRIEEYQESIEPVIADTDVETGLGRVGSGRALGQHQHATARVGDRPAAIEYDLWMYAGCEEVDQVRLDGDPVVNQRIEGGVNGDIGTEAVICNLVGQLGAARPGLLTMASLASLG